MPLRYFFKTFRWGIDSVFRIVVILILLSLSATAHYYYQQFRAYRKAAGDKDRIIKEYHEKEIIRERNKEGQEKVATPAVVIDARLVRKVMAEELRDLEKRWDVKADKRADRLYSKTDVTFTTRLDGLKFAKVDTVINVITIAGKDTTRRVRISTYNDGYNQLKIVDTGDSLHIAQGSRIRNKYTSLAYAGPFPRLSRQLPVVRQLPAFWKPRPILTEAYCYNPLTGTDTLRHVITNRRIKQRQLQ